MGRRPILAVVGELQFDVVLARLLDEYNVEARLERLPHTCARWISGSDAALERLGRPRGGSLRCTDRRDQPVLLFESQWNLDYCRKENPELVFSEMS
jgi:peptide chain release factor 3